MNTIQKRQHREKGLVLESLRKMPIIGIVCVKTGVSRATFYRWKATDAIFAKEADSAQAEGEAVINELAESKIIKAINDDNLTSAMYWLNHREPRFSSKVEIATSTKPQEALTTQQEKTVKEALALIGIIENDNQDTH